MRGQGTFTAKARHSNDTTSENVDQMHMPICSGIGEDPFKNKGGHISIGSTPSKICLHLIL